jgi:CTP:molybdopterin cytidylyltransferase MocA
MQLVPVDDQGMLLDMDTPAEYDRVVEHLRSEDTSSRGV